MGTLINIFDLFGCVKCIFSYWTYSYSCMFIYNLKVNLMKIYTRLGSLFYKPCQESQTILPDYLQLTC